MAPASNRLHASLAAIKDPDARAAVLAAYSASPDTFYPFVDVAACLVASRADLVATKRWFDATDLRIILEILLPGFSAAHLLAAFVAFKIPVRIHSASRFDARYNCPRLYAQLRAAIRDNFNGKANLLAVLDRAAQITGVALAREAKVVVLLDDLAATSAAAPTITSTSTHGIPFDPRTAN